jgi:hypothetical protein
MTSVRDAALNQYYKILVITQIKKDEAGETSPVEDSTQYLYKYRQLGLLIKKEVIPFNESNTGEDPRYNLTFLNNGIETTITKYWNDELAISRRKTE